MSTDKKKKANVNTGNLTRWLTTQRYIRIGHNKQIKAYFKTSSKGSTRERLRNTLLMYKEDSAQQILVKMQYFQQYLSGVKTLTSPIIPDTWQVKVGANRPQLVVVFKPKSTKSKKPNSRWSLAIPHFSFTKNNIEQQLKKIPDYDKGNYQGVYTLKDNSKLVVYGKSSLDTKRFIKGVVNNGLINRQFLTKTRITDGDIRVGEIDRDYQEVLVTPTYAKYYSTGQKNLQPDWVSFIE